MNPVKGLQDHRQAVWLDFLSRGFIADGRLKKLVDDDGLRGLTSDPSIFGHAIGQTDEYDDAIKAMLQSRDYSAGEIFEGRWTIMAAIEEAVSADVLSAALYARFRSRRDHTFAEKILSAMRKGFGAHVEPKVEPKERKAKPS
jgi:transaldolase